MGYPGKWSMWWNRVERSFNRLPQHRGGVYARIKGFAQPFDPC